MIYSAWGNGDGYAHTCHPTANRPAYGDGRFMEDCTHRVWIIEADSWEEAMTKYHVLQGWEPYVPMTRIDLESAESIAPTSSQ